MFSTKSFTAAGKPTEKKGVFISVDNDFFFMCLGHKKNAEQALDKLQNLGPNNTIKELHKHFSQLEKDGNCEGLVVAKIVNNIFYGGVLGKMHLLLKRADKMHSIFDPAKTYQTTSGFIKADDIFIFTTSFGKELIDKKNLTENLEESVTSLSEKINGLASQEQEEAGLLFVRFLKEENAKREIKLPAAVANMKLPSIPFAKIAASIFSRLAKINTKLMKIAASAIILILIGVIAYNAVNGFIKRSREKVAAEIKKVEELQNNLNQAQELVNLNNVRARTIAEQTLSQIKSLDLAKLISADNKKKIESIQSQLEKTLKEASNVVQSKAELVYSTTLLKKNSTATEIIMDGNKATILDASQNLVYAVNFDNKKANVFDLAKFGKNPKFLAASAGLTFVFYNDSVVQIDVVNNKIKTVLKKDSEWKKIVNLESYAENLYLLDTETGQIWKYIREDGGYSLIKPYFSKSESFKNAVSFAIDSAVYVVFDNGQIKKYLSGEEITDKWQFNPKKLPEKELVTPSKILTNENLDNVYVLEPTNKRIVILSKEGKYQKQILDGKLAGTKAFGVNEKDKKIYFSVGSEIYVIQM